MEGAGNVFARGDARPASASPPVWIKASRLHPLIPRETPRYRKLYRGAAAVEREFGRLKDDRRLLRCASMDWIGSGCTRT